jgi:A/G-specific adenine glycosylase
VIYCAVGVVRRADGAVLVEQRPGEGLWGGLWQAPTMESVEGPPGAEGLARAIGLQAAAFRPEAAFEHGTTHRRVIFQVWRAESPAGFTPRRGLWMTAGDIGRLGLSTPQRRILLENARGGTLWT